MTNASEPGSTPTELRERRRALRRSPDPREPIAGVRLRAGRELVVVNIAPSGALVEGPMRLLPGTHVDVHIATRHGRVLVRSRVVRAYVSDLRAEAVRYRGALAFDRVVDTTAAGYAIPEALLDAIAAPGHAYPQAAGGEAGAVEIGLDTGTIGPSSPVASALVRCADTAAIPQSPEAS